MYSTPYYSDTLTQAELDATTATINVPEGFFVWISVASIIAIVCGILTYFLFVRKKSTPKGKFAKWLKDFFNFKIMWLEPIIKIIYYIATFGAILASFGFLSLGVDGILPFFLVLILGPVFIRLGYEAVMMFVMIWRNTKDISDSVTSKKK